MLVPVSAPMCEPLMLWHWVLLDEVELYMLHFEIPCGIDYRPMLFIVLFPQLESWGSQKHVINARLAKQKHHSLCNALKYSCFCQLLYLCFSYLMDHLGHTQRREVPWDLVPKLEDIHLLDVPVHRAVLDRTPVVVFHLHIQKLCNQGTRT